MGESYKAMKENALELRMKLYEGAEAGRRFMPKLPILARLDGRSFHSFCRGLKRPFDEDFKKLMVSTTKFLVEETNAIVGYRQSDEITLLWYSDDPKSQVFFDGRIMKMTSTLAALATARFNRKLSHYLPDKAHLMPTFDCRVWQVPTLEEAANVFLWREQDATRNSIQAAGQAHFSHKQLHGKDTKDIQEMLFQEKGINWNDYPAWAKRGTWVRRERVVRPFTTAEIEKLPAKHEARRNPALQVERWETREFVLMCRFAAVRNRVEVVFQGAAPIPVEFFGDKFEGELLDTSAARVKLDLMDQEDARALQTMAGATLVTPSGMTLAARLGRQLFPTQPMPDGALPIYDGEPKEEDKK